MLNTQSEEYKYGILFIFSLFYEYINLEYVHIHIIYRVNQAEYVTRILAAASQERVKQSTGHTHTGHTDRENTPDTGTHTRTTRPRISIQHVGRRPAVA